MTDAQGGQELTANSDKNAKDQARIIYILYLVGFVVPITPLIGVVMAYLAKGEAPEWLASHYTWQIRTFWIALAVSVVGLLLCLILIGFLVLLLELVWFIVRCVKGFQYLEKGEALPDSSSLLF